MATHARGGEAGPSTQTNPTTVEARTALRRGANLLKYCRNAKPHVAYFQLSKDETTLEWVSKGAKVKAVRMGLVTQVIAGRETNAFRSSKHKHPPDQCFSLMYAEAEGKKPRSLDLVCEDATTAQLWRLGLDAVRQRGGTGVTSEAFSSDDEDGAAPSSPIRDAKLDTMASDLGVAMKVNSAASKFMKLRSKGGGGTSVGSGRPRHPRAPAAHLVRRPRCRHPGDAPPPRRAERRAPRTGRPTPRCQEPEPGGSTPCIHPRSGR